MNEADQILAGKLQRSREHARKPILCLDFDGVIHSYASGWQGAAIVPDPPVAGAVAFLHAAVERFRVCIFSSRSNQPGGREAMQAWLMMFVMRDIDDRAEAAHVLSLIEWPTEKPAALVTIDDRAITFNGQWPSLDAVASFRPWNKPLAEHEVSAAEKAYGALWRETAHTSAGLSEARKQLLTAISKDGQRRGIAWAIQKFGPAPDAEVTRDELDYPPYRSPSPSSACPRTWVGQGSTFTWSEEDGFGPAHAAAEEHGA